MTDQTVAINGYEEEVRGWAVPDGAGQYVAVYACTDQDWANDAEAGNEAPSQELAEMVVGGGVLDADEGWFATGSREEVVETIRRHVATDADKLVRNLLAVLDQVIGGDQLYDPSTPEEEEARAELLADYATLRGQVAATFAHPLGTDEEVHHFLMGTKEWGL